MKRLGMMKQAMNAVDLDSGHIDLGELSEMMGVDLVGALTNELNAMIEQERELARDCDLDMEVPGFSEEQVATLFERQHYMKALSILMDKVREQQERTHEAVKEELCN